MSKQTVIVGEHQVRVERDMIEVWSNSPEPDPSWQFTDVHGHEHYYESGYPTLQRVWEEPYFCSSCREEHQDSYFVCYICGVEIEPKTRVPFGPKYMPGTVYYFIDDQPATKEEVNALFADLEGKL